MSTYTVREELKPSGLNGISDEQINDHWKLYSAYVTQSNNLTQQLADMRAAGEGSSPAYMDRRRRFGFEYNGMVLHEFYFGNLKAGQSVDAASQFVAAVSEQWGSFEAWQEDFANTGKTRGIGWAICYADPVTGKLDNHFVQLHEEGNIASFQPIVVMDVWEHAYMVDHPASGRPSYIEAFLSNVNWPEVEARYNAAVSHQATQRFAA
jgi:Fe-Mn family superoxide dismutase